MPSGCHRLPGQVAHPSAPRDRCAGRAAGHAGRSAVSAWKASPFLAVLLIACSAVVTGARSFVAIDEWAADAPQDVLARLGARIETALAVRVPPSGATIRRVIKDRDVRRPESCRP